MESTPTDRELDILKILWKKGSATVREVWKELCELEAQTRPDRDLAYTTVLAMLQVMQKKGQVIKQADGKAHQFSAAQSKSQTVSNLADQFLQKVFDGAKEEYLVHLLDPREVTFEELDRLEKMISDVRNEKENEERSEK